MKDDYEKLAEGAACKGLTDLYYRVYPTSRELKVIEDVCGSCPVIEECITIGYAQEHSLSRLHIQGYRHGMSARTRQRVFYPAMGSLECRICREPMSNIDWALTQGKCSQCSQTTPKLDVKALVTS